MLKKIIQDKGDPVNLLRYIRDNSGGISAGSFPRHRYRYTDSGRPPAFDKTTFRKALTQLYSNTKDSQSLMQNIQAVNDQCLYHATLISLVLFSDTDKHNVYNATTQEKLTRKLQDWSIRKPGEAPKSIADYALSLPAGTILSFKINTPETQYMDFHQIPPDYADRMLIVDPKQKEEMRLAEYIKTADISHITDYHLLRKDTPANKHLGTGPFGLGWLRSAMLAPLWFDGKLQGLLLIGNDYVNSYTADGQIVLGDTDNLYFRELVDTVALTANKISRKGWK